MKKLKLFLFALTLVFITSTTVLAESKWDTIQPVKQTTSDGIDIEYQTKVEFEYDCWYQGEKLICDESTKLNVDISVDVIITIPSNYEKDTIVIAPEVLQELARQNQEQLLLENGEYLQLNNSLEPGDNIKVNLTIINNSRYTYTYDEKSFDIFPVENTTFTRGEKNTTFNGLNIGEDYITYRLANPALKDLGLDKNHKVTDENIDTALKKLKDTNGNQKYPNGINDLAKYYVDYYNTKYNTNHTRLDEFSYGVIREILGYNDTIERVSRNIGKFPTLYNAFQIYKDKFLQDNQGKIAYQDDVLKYAGFTGRDATEIFANFAKDEYSKMCGEEVTSFDTMCEEAQNEFFANYGNEMSPYILETNKDILNLSYNYFYNKNFSLGLEDDEVTDADSNKYSIGEYMRDEDKGEDTIKEQIGLLESNTANGLKMTFYINGAYTCNAYLGYNFMINMQLSYSALKGVLVVNHVDSDGNRLTEDVTTTDLVGNEYTTEKKDFEGYTFITVEGEPIGTYIDGTIRVTYYYDKNTGTGNIEVLPPQTGFNGSNITTTNVETITLYKKEERELI